MLTVHAHAAQVGGVACHPASHHRVEGFRRNRTAAYEEQAYEDDDQDVVWSAGTCGDNCRDHFGFLQMRESLRSDGGKVCLKLMKRSRANLRGACRH